MKKKHTLEALVQEVKEVSGVKDTYIHVFPATSEDTCLVLSFTGGQPTRDTVVSTTLQVVSRANMPNESYDIITEVTDYLCSLQDARLSNGDLVIQCRTQHPYPFYLGEDENRRHIYSMTMFLLLSME